MGAWLSHFMMAAAEITNTSVCGESLSPKGVHKPSSLLGHLGDDVGLSEQRVLLVLQLDLGAAKLGQENRVANLKRVTQND